MKLELSEDGTITDTSDLAEAKTVAQGPEVDMS